MSKEIEAKDVLNNVYKDVSDWLKFAEAKNLALLTFNGVILFGILRLIEISNSIFEKISGTLYLCSAIILINIIIVLFSFVPALRQTDKTKNVEYKEHLATKNYLFYGHLKDLNEQNLLEAITEKYKISFDNSNPYYNDFGLQILSVSSIAWRKYRFFTFCTYINVFVFLIVILRVIIWKMM